MKRSLLPTSNTRQPLRGFCLALVALGILPVGAVFAASPILPTALQIAPMVVAAGDDDDANLDPDYLYLQAITQESARYRTANGSNYRKAISLYDEAIKEASKKKKDFYDAIYHKAVCNYLLKQYDRSIKDSTKHIELRPEVMQAYVIRAQAFVKKQNYDPALADLDLVEKKRPDLMEYRLRGQIYFARQGYEKAAGDFETYAAMNTDSKGRIKLDAIVAFLDLGNTYALLNKNDRAVEAFSRYIAAYPDTSVAWQYRGDKEYDDLPYALDKRGSAYLELARKADSPDAPELAQAESDYNKYVELQPQSPTGYIGLGNIALLRKNWDVAVQTLSKAVELGGSTDAVAVLAEARRLQSSEGIASNATPSGGVPSAAATASLAGLQKSVTEFNEALVKDPKNVLALRGRGLANSNAAIGNYTQAVADFTQLLTVLPAGDSRIQETYFNRAAAYANMNPPQFDKALADFDAVIGVDPKNTRAYIGRGDAYAQLGQFDKAVADYNVVISGEGVDDTTKLNARRNRGVSYQKMSPPRLDEAVADFDAYLTVHPDDEAVKNSKFNAEIAQGDEKKLVALTAKIAEVKDKPDLYLQRASVYDTLKRYDEAIADYKKTIALDPNNKVAYQNLAADYAQKGYADPATVDAAIAANTKLIALEPTNTTFLLARGDLYGTKKQFVEAAADYKQALTLLPPTDPKRADVEYLVANLYLASGNTAAAKTEFDAYFAVAQPTHPKYNEALVAHGDLLRAGKDYPGAIADYTKFLTAQPGSVKVLKVRGQSYLDSGDEVKALADFEAAIAAAPTDSEALTLAASLYYNQAAKLAATDPDKAVPVYKKSVSTADKAIASDASYAGAYYFKGLSLAEDAEIDNLTPVELKAMRQDALKSLQKFIQLAPDNAQVPAAKKLIDSLTKAIGA